MPKGSKPKRSPTGEAQVLNGWKQIAEFLGEPVTVVKRWASEGMPVTEQGRFVVTSPDQLSAWLGRESGKPVRLATPDTDLMAELKRGIAFARSNSKSKPKSHKA